MNCFISWSDLWNQTYDFSDNSHFITFYSSHSYKLWKVWSRFYSPPTSPGESFIEFTIYTMQIHSKQRWHPGSMLKKISVSILFGVTSSPALPKKTWGHCGTWASNAALTVLFELKWFYDSMIIHHGNLGHMLHHQREACRHIKLEQRCRLSSSSDLNQVDGREKL